MVSRLIFNPECTWSKHLPCCLGVDSQLPLPFNRAADSTHRRMTEDHDYIPHNFSTIPSHPGPHRRIDFAERLPSTQSAPAPPASANAEPDRNAEGRLLERSVSSSGRSA